MQGEVSKEQRSEIEVQAEMDANNKLQEIAELQVWCLRNLIKMKFANMFVQTGSNISIGITNRLFAESTNSTAIG